jgi:hypothetical protein
MDEEDLIDVGTPDAYFQPNVTPRVKLSGEILWIYCFTIHPEVKQFECKALHVLFIFSSWLFVTPQSTS